MVNEDILGGLISAISRGYSLKRAMTSLYNAGYKKEEIEEAAIKLQQIYVRPQREWSPKDQPSKKDSKSLKKLKKQPLQAPESSYGSSTSSVSGEGSHPSLQSGKIESFKKKRDDKKQKQKSLSGYEKKADTGGKLIVIVLVSLLLLLIGLLSTVIIFRQEVIEIFSRIFIIEVGGS